MHDRLPGDALRGDLVPNSFLASVAEPLVWRREGRRRPLKGQGELASPSADLGPQFPSLGYVTPEEN